MTTYFNRKDRRVLKNIANLIMLNYSDNVSIHLSDEQQMLVARMKMIYEVDKTLIVEDWKNSFPDMIEEEAYHTMDIFLGANCKPIPKLNKEIKATLKRKKKQGEINE